jgi:hypothetical protein
MRHKKIPLHSQEFNTVAALVFAQIDPSFPVVIKIDRDAVAKAMGVKSVGSISLDWAHRLTSGRAVSDVVAHTILWLIKEDYIQSAGLFPGERATLTEKGMRVMSFIPNGLSEYLGEKLVAETSNQEKPLFNISAIGDLIGGAIGGFTKSMSAG